MSKNKETNIQNRAIVHCSDIAYLWNYTVGKFYTLDARLVTVGVPGFPDVFGFRKSDGKFIVLEFKTEKGKLREDQVQFQKSVAKNNISIIYGVPRSVEDAKRIILEGENNAL